MPIAAILTWTIGGGSLCPRRDSSMSKTTTELEQELYEAKLETRRLRAEMSMALRFTKDDEMDAEATRRAISKFLKIEY
jgi:hypothetical protein